MTSDNETESSLREIIRRYDERITLLECTIRQPSDSLLSQSEPSSPPQPQPPTQSSKRRRILLPPTQRVTSSMPAPPNPQTSRKRVRLVTHIECAVPNCIWNGRKATMPSGDRSCHLTSRYHSRAAIQHGVHCDCLSRYRTHVGFDCLICHDCHRTLDQKQRAEIFALLDQTNAAADDVFSPADKNKK